MKKFFVVLMVVAMSIAPVFAGEALEVGEGTGAFSVTSISKIVTLATGIVPGALIAIKFMFDVVSAYYHREQDPSKLQKAIVNFIIVVIVVIGYVVVVNFLFTEDASDSNNGGGRADFLKGLTTSGAEISADVDAVPMDFDLSGFSVEGIEELL